MSYGKNNWYTQLTVAEGVVSSYSYVDMLRRVIAFHIFAGIFTGIGPAKKRWRFRTSSLIVLAHIQNDSCFIWI